MLDPTQIRPISNRTPLLDRVEFPADLRGGPGERSPPAKSAMQANRAFAPNCGCFYEIAIRADDHQRNEAG